MLDEVIVVNPSGGFTRYPAAQEQIDDILSNELKDFIKVSDEKRHQWIQKQIDAFFDSQEA